MLFCQLILFVSWLCYQIAAVPPPPPQNLFVSTIPQRPMELLLSWKAPNLTDTIANYTAYCNTSANQAYPEQVIGSNVPTIRSVVNGTTLATTLTGLNPYTQYSCYVTANTSVGEGNSSNIATNITFQSGENV